MHRKYRAIGAALATIMSLAACTSAQQRSSPNDEICSGAKCTSPEQFAQMISIQLNDRVRGYVVIVGSHTVERGLARTFANPPRRTMTANVPISIASIGKLFTTVAAIKLLDQHGLSVDAKIRPYLPYDWAEGPGVETITFRELLTHRAGFRHNSNDVFADNDAARRQIEDGVRAEDKGTAEYNNLNFAVFKELLPALAGVADPGPAQRSAIYDQAFKDIIRRQVFDLLGITEATCDGPPASPPAAIYPALPDSIFGPPQGVETPPGAAACAAGGWIMSPSSLHLFVTDLISGSKLLSGSQKQLMNNNCLGWDCSVFSQPGYRGKSGSFNVYNAELSTFVGIFVNEIPVVIVTNSRPPGPPSEIAYDSFVMATQ
jgi:CubicO group peptidase (beta-lactamase class C family)